MSAGGQNYSRAAQFKCLPDSTIPLSVWIVPSTARPDLVQDLPRAEE